jgi:hypothetical protein
MIRIEQFFAVVDAYKAATGLPDKTVSSRVLNDSSRIDLLRAGGDIGVRKVAAALQWFSDNWPGNAAWPEGVIRPETAFGQRGADIESAGRNSAEALLKAGDNGNCGDAAGNSAQQTTTAFGSRTGAIA